MDAGHYAFVPTKDCRDRRKCGDMKRCMYASIAPTTPARVGQARVSDEEINKLCRLLEDLHGIGFDFVDGKTCLANMMTFDLRDERTETARLRVDLAAAKARADNAKAERDEAIEALELERTKKDWTRDVAKALDRARHACLCIADEIEDEGDRVYFGSTMDADRLKKVAQELDNYGWSIALKTDHGNVFEEVRSANARIAELEKADTRTREIINRMREEWRQKTDSTDYDVCIDAESRMEAAEAILAALDTPTEGGEG